MKKNTQFLLIALLSVSAFSHSMDEQNNKKKLEPQATGAAAAGAGAKAAQAKNAPTIAGFLELANVFLPMVKDNLPVSKAQLIDLAKHSQAALIDLDNHNEFTKTYIQDIDALVASLITLRPQAESLRNRSVEFMMHAKEVPSAVIFAQKLEAIDQIWKNSQKDPNDMLAQALAAQAKKFEDERERREKEHQAFMEHILKQQTDMMNRFFAKAKADVESTTK